VKMVIGSVLAATGASICCIGPVFLSALGAGAVGAAAAQFEAYRPILLTVTVALLGAAFYTTYRPPASENCGPEGTCQPASKRVARIGLWVATPLVILLATFPYYVGQEVTAQVEARTPETATCTLQVAKMTCAGCAAAVNMAAKQIDGVNDATVSYEKGTIEVRYDPSKTNPDAIAKAITEKSGFPASVPKKSGK
jgi:mercuric ion transport protein